MRYKLKLFSVSFASFTAGVFACMHIDAPRFIYLLVIACCLGYAYILASMVVGYINGLKKRLQPTQRFFDHLR